MVTVKILLVQQSRSAVDWLPPVLEKKGFEVTTARSQKAALERLAAEEPHLVIVDDTCPRLSGPKICRAMREQSQSVPIILILEEGVRGDDMGATMRLVLPFTSRKLMNRIRKVMPREDESVLRVSDVVLNLKARSVTRGGVTHHLTPKQCKLLALFMRHPGQVLTRRFIMNQVWETDYLGDTRTLYVHLRWLREKIEENPGEPVYLRTVRNVGYCFAAPEAEGEGGEEKT
ncbi:MAG: response regulator transcription factor [Chloroflexota bacterium]|nr:response regulator transcription factor [Chloroflexota bacterium]